jgi:nitroimidazol reductase NimA-like FMN-containing flavoprotein (pyridoxamine 5'-phosphate oxidase superfamily)
MAPGPVLVGREGRPVTARRSHVPGELEVLTERECRDLLRQAAVGRLGLSADSLPVILPVNFVVDGESVVFRTGAGLKLSAATAGDVACLEVDDIDAIGHGGWSVLVTGRLREITDPDELEAAQELPLAPWWHRVDQRYVRLSMDLLSGRRL